MDEREKRLTQMLQSVQSKVDHIEQRRKKIKKALVVGVLLLILLATGTYAWTSFNQRAINPLWAVALESNPGGRIHNNYDGFGSGVHNQDIYAENFGDSDLFVRIQLREFLSLDGFPIGDTDIYDPGTWPVYISDLNDVHARREGTDTYDIGAAGVTWQLGEEFGAERKMFMPTHNQVTEPAIDTTEATGVADGIFDNPNTYLMTSTTGNAVDWIASGNLSGITHMEGFAEEGEQTGATIDDGSHDFWRNRSIENQIYIAPLLESYEDSPDTIVVTPAVEHRAQETLAPEEDVSLSNGRVGVMTVANWQELPPEEREGNFWILDRDGWFYWNGAIPPGEGLLSQATSLLLDEIAVDIDGDDWEYATAINGEFFTTNNASGLQPSMSPEMAYLFGAPVVELPPLDLPETFFSFLPVVALEGQTTIEAEPNPDAFFTDPTSGVEWLVVADYGEDVLIMTRHVHMFGRPYFSRPGGVLSEHVPLELSTIKTDLDEWFNEFVPEGSAIRARTLDYAFQNYRDRSSPGAGIEHYVGNMASITAQLNIYCPIEATRDDSCQWSRAISMPAPAAIPGSFDRPTFILSETEVNTYIAPPPAFGDMVNSRSRRATTPENAGTTTRSVWWMRSIGTDVVNVRVIDGGGQFGAQNPSFQTVGVRPALWIRR